MTGTAKKRNWQPDPEREGWEFCIDTGVRISRPAGGRVILDHIDGPIPLDVAADIDFEIVSSDTPRDLPCKPGYEHLFGKPWKCADPTEIGRKCSVCGKNRYVKADGEIVWAEPAEHGGMVFHHRFSLGPKPTTVLPPSPPER